MAIKIDSSFKQSFFEYIESLAAANDSKIKAFAKLHKINLKRNYKIDKIFLSGVLNHFVDIDDSSFYTIYNELDSHVTSEDKVRLINLLTIKKILDETIFCKDQFVSTAAAMYMCLYLFDAIKSDKQKSSLAGKKLVSKGSKSEIDISIGLIITKYFEQKPRLRGYLKELCNEFTSEKTFEDFQSSLGIKTHLHLKTKFTTKSEKKIELIMLADKKQSKRISVASLYSRISDTCKKLSSSE